MLSCSLYPKNKFYCNILWYEIQYIIIKILKVRVWISLPSDCKSQTFIYMALVQTLENQALATLFSNLEIDFHVDSLTDSNRTLLNRRNFFWIQTLNKQQINS